MQLVWLAASRRRAAVEACISTTSAEVRHAETGGGSIEVGTVSGELGLHTGGGSIEVHQANGKLVAETGGGSVEIQSCAHEHADRDWRKQYYRSSLQWQGKSVGPAAAAWTSAMSAAPRRLKPVVVAFA